MSVESAKPIVDPGESFGNEEFFATRDGQGEVHDLSTEALELLQIETFDCPRDLCAD